MLAMLEDIKLLRSQTSGMKMAMMGGMMGDGMMGDGMTGGGMMGMHKMMEQRVDTLEQFLEQAIKHAHQREARRTLTTCRRMLYSRCLPA